jgi:predicted dehydrogenase
MSNNDVSRRDVLKGSAMALVGLAGGTLAEGSERVPGAPASESQQVSTHPLRFGIIGCGGKGWSGMQDASQFGNIVALVDIDANNRTKAMLEHPRATAFDDYREMFEAMKGKLDAVVISIPDHHHAPASALAMHHGLHTYCEKPLTRTIWEARQLARIARQTRVATQMGNQSTASTPMRKAAALIQAGTFGAPKEVHVWTDRAKGWWPQGVDRPAPATAPKTVDFEMWLGPRPERPFAEGYHPFAWRGWWDFGTGALGDMGCHIFNMPFMALNLRDPIAVRAETAGHNRDSFPEWAIVHYEFGELNGRPPVNVTWYDSGKRPDASLVPGLEIGGNGSIIVCEKATIMSMDESNENIKIVGGAAMPDIQVDESPGHMAEFARAALGGKPARANFPDYAGPLAETVLLGNLAIWANGPRLEWDAKHMKVKGTDEFDSLIHPAYRTGFGV